MKTNRLLLVLVATILIAGTAHAEKIRSFCEYGTGFATEISPAGGLWEQSWGKKTCEWYDCLSEPDVGFLDENIVGLLQTITTGAPQIDENYILRFPLFGQLTLTALEDNDPDVIAGQITGNLQGIFVADLNADNAIVDEEAGTITVLFGAPVHDGPDGQTAVTETTGKFKSICPAGLWEWHVSGTITAVRLSYLDLQTNILAALTNPSLILAAEEEIVLSGSYYRSSPEE